MDISKFCQENNCIVHVIDKYSRNMSIKEDKNGTWPEIVQANRNVLYYLKTIKNNKIGFAKFYKLEDLSKAYKIATKNSVNFKKVELPEIQDKPKDNFKKIEYDPNEIFQYFDFDIKYDKKDVETNYVETKHEIYDPYGNHVEYTNNILNVCSIIIVDGKNYYYIYNGYDPIKICKRIKNEIAFQYENTKEFKEIDSIKNMDIVFYDHSVEDLIDFILAAFNGKLFKENKVWSSLHFEDMIFNEKFNIIEDPRGNFIRKYYVDDDGIKTTKKYLVRNGIINKMCYDFYTSTLYGEEPTGNGFYIPELYGIDQTNIDIKCEKTDTDRYLMIIDALGFHTCNKNTGDVNIVCSLGFVYDRGSIYGVKNVPVSFNLLKVAKKIYGFGDKKDMNELKTPNIVIKNDTE